MFYRIITLLALFFFSACANRPPAQQTAQEPARKPANQQIQAAVPLALPATDSQARTVKIGLLVPLSGEAASVGNALQDAAILAIADKYGNQTKGQNIKVVLVPKDTKGTPQGAAEAAKQVLSSGAELIIGPLFSTEVRAVSDTARPYGVSVLTFSNNPEAAADNVFVFGFLVEHQVNRVVGYAMNHNLSQIALLAPNNPYGFSVQKTVRQMLEGNGLNLASEAYYHPSGNFTAELDQIAAIHAQHPLSAIVIPESGKKLQLAAQGLTAKGVAQPQVRFLGTGLWDDAATLRSGTLVGGWFASSPPERFLAYERRFSDYFGYVPPRISALAYDVVALASALAVNSANGKIDTAAITDPAGYNGPANGLFRCYKTGLCERGLAILEVTANGAKVIDPAPRSF